MKREVAARILIAEDDGDVRFFYRMILGEQYEVLEAGNGQEAVEIFRARRPDLTLMDISMPVKTGDEAIREIRLLDPGARIVAVTAYDLSGGELGVPVLRKGFSGAEFLEVVRDNLPEGEERPAGV